MTQETFPAGEERLAAIRDLLRLRAIATGLCTDTATEGEVDTGIETLLDREVTVPAPTQDECRRWYDLHPDEFVAGEIVFARHILFAVTPRTPVDALRRKAEETLIELRQSPEQFEQRARELSNCPSGTLGGSLGQLLRGESVPEFERAVFAGDVTGVLPGLVNTRYGFHIIAVDRRVPGRRVPFDAVQGEISARLTRLSWHRALAQYAQLLLRAREVSGEDVSRVA